MKTEILIAIIGAMGLIIAAIIGLFKRKECSDQRKSGKTIKAKVKQINKKGGENTAYIGVNNINSYKNTEELERR